MKMISIILTSSPPLLKVYTHHPNIPILFSPVDNSWNFQKPSARQLSTAHLTNNADCGASFHDRIRIILIFLFSHKLDLFPTNNKLFFKFLYIIDTDLQHEINRTQIHTYNISKS